MIQSTYKLVEYLKLPKKERESDLILSYVNSILKLGSYEDASLLLDAYLESPYDFDYCYLLGLFFKFGDLSFANKIYKQLVIDGKLDENADLTILHLLGALKYEPIKSVLFKYSFSNNDESDYHFQTSSILGLLNFDCLEYHDVIRSNIEYCFNKNLFAEFVPSLVCKLPDNKYLLEQLYELGNTTASTDCNAGIILGFSLCGEEGKKYFKSALFNPNWETYSGSTGTVGYTYEGMKNLKMTFSEIYEDIKKLGDDKELSYSLDVFFSLLEIQIFDYSNENIEAFSDLYLNLFKWETPDNENNLITLSRRVGLEDKAYTCKREIEFKMTEEIIIQNYGR